MAGYHRWEDMMIAKYGNEGYARLRAETAEEMARDPWILNGEAIRQACGLSADEFERIGSELCRDDNFPGEDVVEGLRRYVEALGGELEVIARFGDKSVKLRGGVASTAAASAAWVSA